MMSRRKDIHRSVQKLSRDGLIRINIGVVILVLRILLFKKNRMKNISDKRKDSKLFKEQITDLLI